MKLPPRWVRRLLLWPLPVVAVFFYVTTVPLLLIAAFVISHRLPGKMRAVRALGLATIYLFVEAAIVVSSLALWIASGFGWKLETDRFVAAHYWMFRQAIQVLVLAARQLFSLEIAADGPDLPSDDGIDQTTEVPLIVMSRHAGPADSLLLLHQVMSWRGRRPRIIAKDLLQFDPALDIMLNRLPNGFIASKPGTSSDTLAAIGDLAAGMTNLDAFVIFPEGGNFSENRRLRAIDRLREGGYELAARRAAELRNVLPPRPAGTKAALAACPTADAVFVAHTGLDEIATIADLWSAIPQEKTLRINWVVLPADQIPRTGAGQEEMLYLAWEAIDHWIETVGAEEKT